MQTKILVLRKNRLAIGLIALCAAILLILFFVIRGSGTKAGSGTTSGAGNAVRSASQTPALSYQPEAIYRAGVYTSTVALGDSLLSLELVLDTGHINSVRLVNLEESVTTMYPLVEPAMDSLAAQLVNGIAPKDVRLEDNKKYTQSLLMEVINATLQKAAVETE